MVILAVLGSINLFALFLVILSCRCAPVKLPDSITKSKVYKEMYNYHCYYWWFFIGSVVISSVYMIVR